MHVIGCNLSVPNPRRGLSCIVKTGVKPAPTNLRSVQGGPPLPVQTSDKVIQARQRPARAADPTGWSLRHPTRCHLPPLFLEEAVRGRSELRLERRGFRGGRR